MKKTLGSLIIVFLVLYSFGNWLVFDAQAATLNVGVGQTYTTIQACIDAAQPGDTCLIHSGTYSGASITRSGTSGNRITILADSSGSQPVITGSFNFGNKSYVTVDGFYMQGSSFSGSGCSFVAIKNNTIDKTGNGINGLASCNDVLVSGNTFRNLTNDIINQWGVRWVIRDNIATNIVDSNDEHLDFWQSWCGGGSGRVPADYSLVENNLYADVSGGNVHFFLFHETTSCGSDLGTNFIIRNNKVRDIGSNGVTFDNDSGAPGFRGVSIYNNSFGELSGGSSSSWQDYVGGIDDSADTAVFLNNILYDAVDPVGAEAISPTSVPADCTLAYDPASTITTDGALRSSSGSIINQNPLFVGYSSNNFSLQSGSPAINAGCSLTRVATADSGSGSTLILDNAWLFQPGWAGTNSDCIAVGSTSNIACINNIDYSTGTVTLSSSISRNDGDPVYLYSDSDGTQVLYGNAPDIGAVEYTSGGATPPPQPPPPPADTTAPTVSISSPANGATVSGSSVSITANASDNVGVAGVQFKLDGSNLGSEDTTSPFTITWNTTTASDGSHSITATARDAAGNTATSSATTLTVNNSAAAIVGDINLDHIVNSVDYSLLNSRWFTNDDAADLNNDGLVNAIDFSLLNANWLRTW